jgi:DNA adenine methylase
MKLSMSVPSPLNWFGGKSKLAPHIVKHFPAHRTYCEPFGGSAAVLFAKEPAKVEVYNDIDRELVNLFQVLRDTELCTKLYAALNSTLYARAEFELAKQGCDDPLEAARRFVVRQRMSFGGKGRDWAFSIENSRRGTAAAIRRWRWGVDSLPVIHERFKNVQIECADWRDVMSRYDSPETLFYCDPPYVPETRVAGTYRHELTQADHRELTAFLLSVRGMVVLSGYAHETHDALQRAGWARIEYPTCTHVSGSLTRRVESLWFSPSVARNGHNRKLFLSPTERMSEGAHHAHKVMVAATTGKVLRAIERLRAKGKKPTATRLARATKMSREHLARKYRHLFATAKV